MKSLRIAIVAGEESGDQLGAELISGIHQLRSEKIEFFGVGGERMTALGLKSAFPMTDIAVMGLTEVLSRLPKIVRLAYQLIDKIVEFKPDILIIIDSPDFTHPVAKRVRKKIPELPIIDYVSPSVWAWRPGRAKKMTAYVDHVLGILPFEPEAYERLFGPKCTYVGHPLVEKITQAKFERQYDSAKPSGPRLLLMPGSRGGEVKRLLPVFGETVGKLVEHFPTLEVDIPAVAHQRARIEDMVSAWQVKPNIVVGESEKFAAFSRAEAALVASGTATLELALWGVPMSVGYKLDPIVKNLKWLAKVDSIVLPNLILGQNVVPEFIDKDCNSDLLLQSLLPLFEGGKDRLAQVTEFLRLQELCSVLPNTPSRLAAQLVLDAVPS
ncbi:MAG: lipid-A-disaccharide synthase [Hyphomicrobiales bacterium]